MVRNSGILCSGMVVYYGTEYPMSDTFHEEADERSIDKIMAIVKEASWHNFYVLTKRSKRMREYFKGKSVPDNLWLGVTVENKKDGLHV